MPRLSLESEVLATSLRSCATALNVTIAARKGLAAILWRLDQEGALVRFDNGVWYVTVGTDTVSAPARSVRPTATRIHSPDQLEILPRSTSISPRSDAAPPDPIRSYIEAQRP